MDYTPETLRDLATDMMVPKKGWFFKKMLAHADAWEADKFLKEHYKAEGDAFHVLNESLRQRLEAAEKGTHAAIRQMGTIARDCGLLDAEVAILRKRLEAAEKAMRDAARGLRNYETSDDELDRIADRLAALAGEETK